MNPQGIHAEENSQKKKTKRVVQIASRAIGGLSVEALLAKRNQQPEFRKQQRDVAIKAAKEAVRTKKSDVKKEKAKLVCIQF
jgi:large subunit ribosomal protein L24e